MDPETNLTSVDTPPQKIFSDGKRLLLILYQGTKDSNLVVEGRKRRSVCSFKTVLERHVRFCVPEIRQKTEFIKKKRIRRS